MKNAQKADTETLGVVLGDLRRGKYVIPDFQREFEWNPWDVLDLMKSIFLDYYIGTLLLWKSKSRTLEALSCENIYGHEGAEKPDYIVLDGQQRLTAINYAFIAPDVNFPRRKSKVFYFLDLINYSVGNYDEAFEYAFNNQKIQDLVGDKEQLFEKHWFPLYLMGSDDPRAVINWIDDYKAYWKLKVDNTDSEDRINKYNQYINNAAALDSDIIELMTRYEISYIELDRDLKIEKVCDIFTQINSRGVKLNIFDLMNAMLKPHDIQLKKMWREVSPKLESLDSAKTNVYLLQVMSILKQSYCSSKYLYFLLPGETKSIRTDEGLKNICLIKDSEEFNSLWQESVDAVIDALKVVSSPREFGAIKQQFLPYPSIIPIFSAIRQFVKQSQYDHQIDIKEKIRRWYWASVFTKRYSSSVESTSAKDFVDLKLWFKDDEALPQPIKEYKNTIETINLKEEYTAGSAIYNAILNLIVINGARDLMTGELPEHEDLDDHHIVPKSWGKENGLSQEINSVCNRTLISESTNRLKIGKLMPSEYLSEILTNVDVKAGSEKNYVREVLDSNFISEKAQEILLRDDFSKDDYFDFIKERERSLKQGIKDLLMNEVYKFQNKNLSLLDKDIEQIEIALRSLICSTLENDLLKLPAHLLANARQKISRMLQKDGTKSEEDYKEMISILSFFDLRELEQVVVSKACWKNFEPVIVNKVTFQKKMDQLAELRNSLRHSRTVDEVAHKEGDAAVCWFTSLLKIGS